MHDDDAMEGQVIALPRHYIVPASERPIDPRPLTATAGLAGACCAAALPYAAVSIPILLATMLAGGAIWAATVTLLDWTVARVARPSPQTAALAGAWAMLATGMALDMGPQAAPAALAIGAALGLVRRAVPPSDTWSAPVIRLPLSA